MTTSSTATKRAPQASKPGRTAKSNRTSGGGGRDLYQEVTDQILGLLDRGVVPWQHPVAAGGPPANLISGKPYRGINPFLLATTSLAKGYESAYWLTYKQARERGGHVRQGEPGSLVIFWKQYKAKDKDTGEDKVLPVLRHYHLFNADQCEGIEAPDVPDATQSDAEAKAFEPVVAAAGIVKTYMDAANPPVIEHGGHAAFYQPSADLIRIPQPERFVHSEGQYQEVGAERYYTTLFHEMIHSTGATVRLDRKLDTSTSPFGSADYSKEELVAEMGAAFLAAASGISPPTIEQSAAYIDGWRRKLSTDKKLVLQAASAAQRAADWVQDIRPEYG